MANNPNYRQGETPVPFTPDAPAQRGVFDAVRDACEANGCQPDSSVLFTLPGCIVRKVVLDPCFHSNDAENNNNGDGGGAAGLAILTVLFAVLARQAVVGYRKNWRLSFALLLVLFLGTTIFGLLPIGSAFELSDPIEFVVIFFASAFLAGVLAFWTVYMLYLVPVVAAGSLVALLSNVGGNGFLIQSEELRLFLIAATGLAGGAWLYWWREVLPERKKKTINKQGPTTGSGGDGNPPGRG